MALSTESASKNQAADLAAKITAAQVEGDCPQTLLDIGGRLTAHLEKMRKNEDKAQQHRIAAGLLVERAIASCDTEGFNAFLKKFCPGLKRSRAFELKAIAAGKKSIDETRADTRRRVAKSRATKRGESVTPPVTDSSNGTSPLAPASNGNGVDPEEFGAAHGAAA